MFSFWVKTHLLFGDTKQGTLDTLPILTGFNNSVDFTEFFFVVYAKETNRVTVDKIDYYRKSPFWKAGSRHSINCKGSSKSQKVRPITLLLVYRRVYSLIGVSWLSEFIFTKIRMTRWILRDEVKVLILFLKQITTFPSPKSKIMTVFPQKSVA